MPKDNRNNKAYPRELKDSIIKRMMPPEDTPVPVLSKETGIIESTLYTWRSKAKRGKGKGTKASGKRTISSREKFIVVNKTFTMNETQLANYCRKHGYYIDEVKTWRESCVNANGTEDPAVKALKEEIQSEKKKIKHLEKEVNRKDKALAETAALLVLQKKLEAIWGKAEEE